MAGMAGDTPTAEGFYATRQGSVAARLLRQRLLQLWPSLAGMTVLGIGYAGPYLRPWREQAARCVAVTPAQLGLVRWPARLPNLSCSAEEDALPFPDLIFDRVLLVHGLEAAENVRRLLREVWRVLKDDGRLLVVAPNRRGLWAHVEATPFGQGQPVFARPDRPPAGGQFVPRRATRQRALCSAAAPARRVAQRAPVRGGRTADSTASRGPHHHRGGQGCLGRRAARCVAAAGAGAAAGSGRGAYRLRRLNSACSPNRLASPAKRRHGERRPASSTASQRSTT